MPAFLAFTLHAPLAAFGGVAVGERRSTWDRPGRSAVLGMIAAALGIDRIDEVAHQALHSGYGLAVRTDATGRLLADYHTAQVPPAQRGRRHPTRAHELAAPGLSTILTRREYRTDALHTVALWERELAPHSLMALQAALLRPAYVLYVGRKGCPLGLPLGPMLIEADGPETALQVRASAATVPEQELRRSLHAITGAVAMDAAAADPTRVLRVEQKRDALASRARWQFGLRAEAVLR